MQFQGSREHVNQLAQTPAVSRRNSGLRNESLGIPEAEGNPSNRGLLGWRENMMEHSNCKNSEKDGLLLNYRSAYHKC